MQVQQLERLPALGRSSAGDLDRLVNGLRRRLGLERLAIYAIRGAMASGVAAMALALGIWLTGGDLQLLWFSAAPLLAALIFGLVRWPSARLTAMTVDGRFGLDDRLATALELARGERASRFAAMQVHDAVERTHAAHGGWLRLDGRARNEALVAAGVAACAIAAMVVVARLERPIPVAQPAADTAVTDVPPAADEQTQLGGVPLDASDQGIATPAPARSAASSADLATRVQQEQAQRSALDTLAQALDDSSAGKAAADAIQQGDFDSARDQLQNLADNADQLSNAAKQQLARGLQQAAAATAQSDRALADREQQAAQALARANYTDQRQALRSLADQVQRSGSRSVPSDQLERDIGQLQQQQQQQQNSAAATSADAANRNGAGAPQAQPGASQSGAAQGAQSGQDANGQQGGGGQQAGGTATSGQNGAGAGEQIGTGVGNGTDPNLYADQPSQLDSTGQQVQVPLRLGAGQGVRPTDGTEDQAAPDPSLGGRTTAELAQEQQTGQVTPEQNLVPGEQRPVVRGYFR